MFYLIKVSKVIVVEWAEGAKMPNYLQSVANTQVATLIQTMQEAGLALDNVHLAGLSLGAQVSDYAGEKFQGRIPRITGDVFSALPESQVTFSVLCQNHRGCCFPAITFKVILYL
jgi:hypothetical protein